MRRLLFIPLLLLALSVGAQSVLRTNSFYTSIAVAGGGYCAEFQVVYDSWTTPPHDSIATKLNTFVKTLVDSSAWDSIDVLKVYAIHTNGASEALVNWKNPGTYNSDAVHSPAFTAFEGFAGDGANDYISWNWIPSTHGVLYKVNNASVGIYIRTNDTGDHAVFGGYDGTRTTRLRPAQSNGICTYLINQSSESSVGGQASTIGFYVVQRTASNAVALYKNNSLLDNETVASNGLVSVELYSLVSNHNVTPYEHTTNQIAMDYAGAASPRLRKVIMDAFEVFMDSNGKGIIP
jgi:hypothetical protein